jgi:hypothetical protein
MSRAGLEPAIPVFEHLGITVCFMFILTNYVTKNISTITLKMEAVCSSEKCLCCFVTKQSRGIVEPYVTDIDGITSARTAVSAAEVSV